MISILVTNTLFIVGVMGAYFWQQTKPLPPVVEVQQPYRCKDASNQGFMVYDYKVQGNELVNVVDGRIFYINFCIGGAK